MDVEDEGGFFLKIREPVDVVLVIGLDFRAYSRSRQSVKEHSEAFW